jgi:hypothetical protein
MACGRCAKRVRAFCKERWARLRVLADADAAGFSIDDVIAALSSHQQGDM